MGKKSAAVLLVLGAAVLLFAEFNRSSVLLDIPTPYVLRHKVIQSTAVGSFALNTPDLTPYDLDVSLGAGIGNFLELSLTAYTLENYSLGVTALVLREKDWYPSVAVGIHDITWTPYIGSFGGGDTLPPGDHDPQDRAISKPGFDYWEQQEWFSAFAVASKQFADYFRVHLGLGRGRYTGYYGFAQYFNTDIFTQGVSEFAVGLFGALEFNYNDWFSVSAEFDGRNINMGTKIGFQNWEVYLALTRMENLSGITGYSPRLVAGLNLYTTPPSQISTGAALSGKVTNPDGSPAAGAKVEVFGDDYNQGAVCNDQGSYRIKGIPAGQATVIASGEGLRSKPVQITFAQGSNEKINFPLRDITDKGSIRGTVRDAEEGSGILANVSVLETSDVVRAGPRGGTYEILGLDPGKYTLKARARGFFDHELTCPVKAGSTTILDIDIRKNWIIFHFKPGEKMIEPRYIPVLEDAVRFLKARPNMVVEIQGHTDSVGDAKENRELSRQRAEAVRDYFITRGISPDRLIVKGYGELVPIGDNRTVLGRDMNRRVELRILSE